MFKKKEVTEIDLQKIKVSTLAVYHEVRNDMLFMADYGSYVERKKYKKSDAECALRLAQTTEGMAGMAVRLTLANAVLDKYKLQEEVEKLHADVIAALDSDRIAREKTQAKAVQPDNVLQMPKLLDANGNPIVSKPELVAAPDVNPQASDPMLRNEEK